MNQVVKGNKTKTTIAIDNELLIWINKMVKLKRFANTTHVIEYALQRIREKEREELHIMMVKEALYETCLTEAETN